MLVERLEIACSTSRREHKDGDLLMKRALSAGQHWTYYVTSSNMAATAKEDYYMDRIHEILFNGPGVDFPSTPTKLLDHLYIGNYKDANNPEFLHHLGITHVVNCAAYRESNESPYAPDSGIVAYLQFHADDDLKYDMLQHFSEAKRFIDRALISGGKVLVHCAMGINRSGVICVAYMMLAEGLDLLQAVKRIKQRRGTVLSNPSFQRQLVTFARQRGLL